MKVLKYAAANVLWTGEKICSVVDTWKFKGRYTRWHGVVEAQSQSGADVRRNRRRGSNVNKNRGAGKVLRRGLKPQEQKESLEPPGHGGTDVGSQGVREGRRSGIKARRRDGRLERRCRAGPLALRNGDKK